MDVEQVTAQREGPAKDLIAKLDGLAREFDHYEYGLPHSDEPMARMLDAVNATINGVVSRVTAERDRLEKQLALEREANAALAARVNALREGLAPFAALALPNLGSPATLRRDITRAAELLAGTEGGA